MTFVSYAQNFEDVMLWRALNGIERGFYIDVGTADPDTDTVTRAFYDRGWSGINIEPVAVSMRRIAATRLRDINHIEPGSARRHCLIIRCLTPGACCQARATRHLIIRPCRILPSRILPSRRTSSNNSIIPGRSFAAKKESIPGPKSNSARQRSVPSGFAG